MFSVYLADENLGSYFTNFSGELPAEFAGITGNVWRGSWEMGRWAEGDTYIGLAGFMGYRSMVTFA